MLSELTAADAAEHDFWRSMLMVAVPDPLFAKDVNGRFVLANRRFTDVFHISADDILGKTDHDVFSREIADAHCDHDQTAIQTLDRVQWHEEISTRRRTSLLPLDGVSDPEQCQRTARNRSDVNRHNIAPRSESRYGRANGRLG